MAEFSARSIRVPSSDETAIVESLRDFLKECPYLPEYFKYINVEYLGAEEDSFGIESVVADPVLREYVDGSSIRQYQFYFTSRELHSMDVVENVQNSQFYELFSEWLRLCTKNRILPNLTGNRKAIDIRANTQGYVVSAENSKAQYMVQCCLRYFKSY